MFAAPFLYTLVDHVRVVAGAVSNRIVRLRRLSLPSTTLVSLISRDAEFLDPEWIQSTFIGSIKLYLSCSHVHWRLWLWLSCACPFSGQCNGQDCVHDMKGSCSDGPSNVLRAKKEGVMVDTLLEGEEEVVSDPSRSVLNYGVQAVDKTMQ